MVYFLDLRGRACRFNPAGSTLTGYTTDQLDNKLQFIQDLVHPDDLPTMRRAPENDIPLVEIDYRLKRCNGTIRWMHSHRLAARDESGKLCGYFCLDRDVTAQKEIDVALRNERDRAREYLNIAGVILVAIDAEQKVTMINRKGCDTLGCSESEILGANWFDTFVPSRDREATRDAFIHLMGGSLETVEHFENRLLGRDGKERLVSWHNTLLRGPDGAIAGTLSSGEDITEKRRAQELLRQTEEQFRALFEGAASCILFLDGRTIRFANDAMLKTFGYTRIELIGADIELLHVSSEMYERAYATAFQTITQKGSWRGDWPLRKKDGSEIWMDNYLTRLSGGGIVAVLHDITERLHAERTLRHREAELSSIFRAAPVGIGLTVERVLRQVNQRLCDMVGYSREELIGKSARILYPADSDFEYVGAEKYRQMGECGTGTVETRFLCSDGHIMDVLLSSTPVDPEDWAKGITFTAMDITERKKNEQALLEKNIALREVLNQISSDQESIREQIATNIDEAILPMLGRLQERASPAQEVLIKQLRNDFEQVSSPFLELLKRRQPRLTPRETEICRLIKSGMTSKQIAETLNVSLGTIHKYRELIRRKLGLANVDVNLTSYLQSL